MGGVQEKEQVKIEECKKNPGRSVSRRDIVSRYKLYSVTLSEHYLHVDLSAHR